MKLDAVIEKWLGLSLIDVRPLSGGDINQVFRLRLDNSNDFVLKLNLKDSYPRMFEKEAAGLQLLESEGCKVPGVEMNFEEGEQQFLILEFIEEGRPKDISWDKFGRELASLHLKTNDAFGLDHDNYIGSLVQINKMSENWTEFFISNRLQPLIRMARDRNLLSSSQLDAFDLLFLRLPDLIPEEDPSLLHGDLWSGNLMFDRIGDPVFIDPAVYYGHREVDIAMTRMFGGFNESFFNSYNEIRPLEKGWQQRIELHNLYPTLVHLVLFGRSYLSGIELTLKRFS